MASLAEALKDKKGFPDAQEITIGDGLKITLGELRGYQEATGQDVAQQLDAERTRIAAEAQKLANDQAEVAALWAKLQEDKGKLAKPAPEGNDWRKDPFFAPIAEHLEREVASKITELSNNFAQVQQVLKAAVPYITSVVSEQRYQSLPEDFRKEVGYDAAVKKANESKLFDSAGVPDVRKVYEPWQSERSRKSELDKVRTEAYEKARQDMMTNSLSRPSGVPANAVQNADPNAPKTVRESFQKLKEDPEFLANIYSLTGQA